MKRWLALTMCVAMSLCAQTYKVGVLLPLTGKDAGAAQSLKNGLLLAEKQLSYSQRRLQLLFEDSTDSPRQALLAARKLTDLEQVKMMVTLGSFETAIMAPIAQEHKIITVMATWDPALAEKHDYVFTDSVTYKGWVRMSLELLKKQGVDSIAAAVGQDEANKLAWAFLKKNAQEYGVKVLEEATLPNETRDVTTAVKKLTAVKPELYFVLADYPACDALLQELRKAQPQAAVSGNLDRVRDKTLANGASYISMEPGRDRFKKLYREEYGNTDYEMTALYGFDTYNILNELAGEFRTWKADKAREELVQMEDFAGAAGVLTSDKNGVIEQTVFLKQVQFGKPAVISWRAFERTPTP